MRRRLVVAAGAVAALAVGGVLLDGGGAEDDGAPPGQQYVDFEGIRFEVPDDYVVQDTVGRVDGQLACPDADGFVLTDDIQRPIYTGATCDPPGEEVVVRIWSNPGMAPNQPGPETASPGGIDYVTFEPASLVFVASEVWVAVAGPAADDVVAAIAESSTPSPDDGLVTPTTADATTEVTDRLAGELGCDTTELATTYHRAHLAPFLGRQAEAPVDCYVDGDGFRILVFRDDGGLDAAKDYYDGVWLVVGDRWAVTATGQDAAAWAQGRIGGAALPPSDCCGPPASDFLPSSR